jgi:hypothetical protein
MSSSVPITAPRAVLIIDPDTAGAQLLANAICDRYATAVVGSARDVYEAMRFPTASHHTRVVCDLRHAMIPTREQRTFRYRCHVTVYDLIGRRCCAGTACGQRLFVYGS